MTFSTTEQKRDYLSIQVSDCLMEVTSWARCDYFVVVMELVKIYIFFFVRTCLLHKMGNEIYIGHHEIKTQYIWSNGRFERSRHKVSIVS